MTGRKLPCAETTFSDAELESMLADLESDHTERKESLKGDSPTTVREAITAFANDLPDHRRAGVVFIGARDDGSPASLIVTDELLRQIADMKGDGNIVPPPTLSIAKRRLSSADMAIVVVEPADSPPVRFKGRIHIRIGPRRGIATAQDEGILSEKRRHRDNPFDVSTRSSRPTIARHRPHVGLARTTIVGLPDGRSPTAGPKRRHAPQLRRHECAGEGDVV